MGCWDLQVLTFSVGAREDRGEDAAGSLVIAMPAKNVGKERRVVEVMRGSRGGGIRRRGQRGEGQAWRSLPCLLKTLARSGEWWGLGVAPFMGGRQGEERERGSGVGGHR